MLKRLVSALKKGSKQHKEEGLRQQDRHGLAPCRSGTDAGQLPACSGPALCQGEAQSVVSNLGWGAATSTGARDGNEDRFSACKVTDTVTFYAVYDGHGGPDVAQHCSDRLHKVLQDILLSSSSNTAELRTRRSCPATSTSASSSDQNDVSPVQTRHTAGRTIHASMQGQHTPALLASTTARYSSPNSCASGRSVSTPGKAAHTASQLLKSEIRPFSWHAGDGSEPRDAVLTGAGADNELVLGDDTQGPVPRGPITHSLSDMARQSEAGAAAAVEAVTSSAASNSCTGLLASCSSNHQLTGEAAVQAERSAGSCSGQAAACSVTDLFTSCNSAHLEPIMEGIIVQPVVCSPTKTAQQQQDWQAVDAHAHQVQALGASGQQQEMRELQEQVQQQKDEVVSGPLTMEETLVKAFLQMDAELEAAGSIANEQGSTAVVALVGQDRLWVANCGDSRALLCRTTGPVTLSSDHKACRQDEMVRVQAAGGFVWWNRVMGELAISRAIGDHLLRPFVIAEPEVMQEARSPADRMLLLASDGLWDVMSNQEVHDLAMATLGTCQAAGRDARSSMQKVAAVLSNTALSRRSRDNVTVLAVDVTLPPPTASLGPLSRSLMQHAPITPSPCVCDTSPVRAQPSCSSSRVSSVTSQAASSGSASSQAASNASASSQTATREMSSRHSSTNVAHGFSTTTITNATSSSSSSKPAVMAAASSRSRAVATPAMPLQTPGSVRRHSIHSAPIAGATCCAPAQASFISPTLQLHSCPVAGSGDVQHAVGGKPYTLNTVLSQQAGPCIPSAAATRRLYTHITSNMAAHVGAGLGSAGVGTGSRKVVSSIFPMAPPPDWGDWPEPTDLAADNTKAGRAAYTKTPSAPNC